jgi:hypothetical protein
LSRIGSDLRQTHETLGFLGGLALRQAGGALTSRAFGPEFRGVVARAFDVAAQPIRGAAFGRLEMWIIRGAVSAPFAALAFEGGLIAGSAFNVFWEDWSGQSLGADIYDRFHPEEIPVSRPTSGRKPPTGGLGARGGSCGI